jgi:hypothetical protein
MAWYQSLWEFLTKGATNVDALNFCVAALGVGLGVWSSVVQWRATHRRLKARWWIELEGKYNPMTGSTDQTDLAPVLCTEVVNWGVTIVLEGISYRLTDPKEKPGKFLDPELPKRLERLEKYAFKAYYGLDSKGDFAELAWVTSCGKRAKAPKKFIAHWNEVFRLYRTQQDEAFVKLYNRLYGTDPIILPESLQKGPKTL